MKYQEIAEALEIPGDGEEPDAAVMKLKDLLAGKRELE